MQHVNRFTQPATRAGRLGCSHRPDPGGSRTRACGRWCWSPPAGSREPCFGLFSPRHRGYAIDPAGTGEYEGTIRPRRRDGGDEVG